MKNSLIIFLFLSIAQLLNAQVDTVGFGGVFINNINNHVLIEGCDTLRIAADFSSHISIGNAYYPYLITKSGSANEADYWSDMPDSVWITEDSHIWEFEVFAYQDSIQEGEECIFFKVESGDDYRGTIKLKVFDEFPQFSLDIESGWVLGGDETICSTDDYVNIYVLHENLQATSDILSYSIDSPTTLFTSDTIHNVYIDISGIGDCNLFEDVFDKVCFSVNYPAMDHLKISLKSPDDKSIILYDGEVLTNTMAETCFNFNSNLSIEDGGSSYSGIFEPAGNWGDIIDGQLNGSWTLIFETDIPNLQGFCSYGEMFFEVENRHEFNYQCDWYAEIINDNHFQFSFQDDFGQTLEEGDVNLQVHALNCSYDLSAPVYGTAVESIDTSICSNESLVWNGQEISYPNEYEAIDFPNQSVHSCDSINEILIDYLPSHLNINFESLSEGETILFDGVDVSDYGSYSAFYTNEYGCDSSNFLTILPAETFFPVDNIPDEIIQSSEGCEMLVCLPFYSDDYHSFDYFVDNVKLENFSVETCQVSSQLYRFVLQGGFSMDMNHEISELEIDGVSYPDFTISNIVQFVNMLNFYASDLAIVMPNGLDLYASRPFHLAYTRRNILTGTEISTAGLVGSIGTLITGIQIPISLGTHEIRLKHKSLDVEKTIIATLENHVYPEPEIDTIRLTYLANVNQRVNFPLFSNGLCGEIISRTSICSNVSPEIVDFTVSNSGLLSFKPLQIEDFKLCVEICDEYNICQIVILDVSMEVQEEEEEELILQRAIFPNPAQNKVSLTDEDNFNIEKVVVHDALGRQVEILNFEPESSVEMDTSRYPEGVYFLTVHINGENYLHKLLIQR